jgi:hypothetical protein
MPGHRPLPPLADVLRIFPNVGFTDAFPKSGCRPSKILGQRVGYGSREPEAVTGKVYLGGRRSARTSFRC